MGEKKKKLRGCNKCFLSAFLCVRSRKGTTKKSPSKIRHESTLISLCSKLRFDKRRRRRRMSQSFVLLGDQRHRRGTARGHRHHVTRQVSRNVSQKPPDSHLWKFRKDTAPLRQTRGRRQKRRRSLEAVSIEGGCEGRHWGQRSAVRSRHRVDSCVCGSAAFVFFALSAR